MGMLDLARTMFYKARIDIKGEQDDDILWSLVLLVRGWALYKARRDGYTLPSRISEWSNFKNGSSMQSEDGGVHLDSVLHMNGDVYTWAARYRETSRLRGFAARDWITEIGFDGRTNNEGTVSIIVSYYDAPGFIGNIQDAPSPSIPRLVAKILESKSMACSLSGVEVHNKAIVFGKNDVSGLYSLICNSDRDIPVILVSPQSDGKHEVEPNKIVKYIGPNALVYYTSDVSAMEALNQKLDDHKLRCSNGMVRVYSGKPNVEKKTDYRRHRPIRVGDIHRIGREGVYRMLRRALAQDVHFWETATRLEDVRRLNRESSREKKIYREKIDIQDRAWEELAGPISELESENASLKDMIEAKDDKIDTLSEENKQLRKERYELNSRCEAYEASFGDDRNTDTDLHECIRAMDRIPCTCHDVARVIVDAFPDRIDFSDRGWKSLDECESTPSTLWMALHDMCTKLHPLMCQGDCDIAKEFGDISNFEYARSEGRQTKKSNDFMAQRKDEYKGVPINIETHICSRTGKPKDDKFARVYFDWLPEEEKLIVGATAHLDNFSTRKAK